MALVKFLKSPGQQKIREMTFRLSLFFTLFVFTTLLPPLTSCSIKPSQALPIIVPESFEKFYKESDVPVYPEIARTKNSSKLSEVLNGLPTGAQTATLNIPGYLFHAASASVLFIASLAFWLQLGFLIYNGQVGWWSIMKLSLFPAILSLSFLLSLRILMTPGALLGGFVRFIPMLTLCMVAALMALRVTGLAMHPDFPNAIQNAGFLLDTSWLVVGALVSLITCWSWGLRTDGHSFLNPWIVSDKGEDYSWVKKKNDKANERDSHLEEGSQENEFVSPPEKVTVGNVLIKGVSLLTSVAASITTLYFGAVLVYGINAGMSPPMIAIMVPLLIGSTIVTASTLSKATNNYWVLANALMAAVGVAILTQCVLPGLLGTGFIALQPGDAVILAAPLRDLASFITTTPIISDLNTLTSGLSPLDLLRSLSGTVSSAVDAVQPASTGFAGFLSNAGDFVKDNLTPARLGAVIMAGVVIINAAMFLVAPPLGATTLASTTAVMSGGAVAASPAAMSGAGSVFVYALSALSLL